MITIVFTTIGKVEDSYLVEAIKGISKLNFDIYNQILIVDNSKNIEFQTRVKNLFVEYKVKNTQFITNQETLKIGENWNTAFKFCQNTWVLFHHDDDFINPNIANNIKQYLAPNEKIGLLSFDFYEHFSPQEKSKYTSREAGTSGILKNTPKFISTIINVEKMKQIGYWDDRAGYFLDFYSFLKLDLLNGSKHIHEAFGSYRIHRTNASVKNKRADTYGNYIPFLISECMPLIQKVEDKKEFLYHVCSFTYSSNRFITKVARRVLRLFGINAWVL